MAIIDADLVGRKKHTFPNLACMKLSAYHKSLNDNVILNINNESIILKGGEGMYNVSKTAIDYIKHLQFEKSITQYYKDKQKEKSELIYVDLNKLLSGDK